MRRPPAIYTINIIESLASQDIRDLLSITIGDNKVTFRELLIGQYGKLYSLYDTEAEIKARAAFIYEDNKLTIERIKKLDEFIPKLADPESFKSITTVEGTGEKNTGVHSESHTDTQSLSASHTKSRGGSSAFGKEFNLQTIWDLEDEELINKVRGLNGKDRQEWEFNSKGEVVRKEITKKEQESPPVTIGPGGIPTGPAPSEEKTPEIQLATSEQMLGETLSMHSIDQGTTRGITTGNASSFSAGGREIKSDSKEERTMKKFVEGKTIEYLQQTNLVNFRERFIEQFYVLFTKRPCH